MHKKGFTLAEVLITLSILGVVAAIMIPNVIQQYQKRSTITKLQKAYANLEIIAQNIAVNTGCIGRDIACTGLLENFDSDKFIEASNLNVASQKTGITRAHYLYCENPSSNCSSTKGSYFSPAEKLYIAKDNIGYLIKRTTIRTFDKNVSGKRVIQEGPGFIVFVFTEPKSKIIYNWKQLRLGRNVFVFTIYDNFQVEPIVVNGEGANFPQSKASSLSDYACNKTDTLSSSGTSCAAKIMKDGWKINY